MDLSIIIVSWRVKELLEQCLASIFSLTRNLDFEVIVIDNDSGDGTVEMVAGNFPQVRLVNSRINLGFARACNLGLRKARGKNILLLNPDTKLIDNSLKRAQEIMEQDTRLGILGGHLLNYDQSTQLSVRSFPTLFDHVLMIFKLHHLWRLKRYFAADFDYSKRAEVDQVMGAFFLISGDLIKTIGDLDESYYIWFEEVDYCQRARQAGFKVVYTPEVRLIHYGGQSFKQSLNLKNQWIFCRSRLRYVLKHQSLFTYVLILLLTPLSLLFSLGRFKNA